MIVIDLLGFIIKKERKDNADVTIDSEHLCGVEIKLKRDMR